MAPENDEKAADKTKDTANEIAPKSEKPSSRLSSFQMKVIAQVMTSWAILIPTFYYVVVLQKFQLPKHIKVDTFIEKLQFMLQLNILQVVIFFASFMATGQLRFHSAAIDPSKKDTRVEFSKQIALNTTEQFLASVFAQLSLIGRLSADQMIIIPAMVGIWCIGRILFTIGYMWSPEKRALGFSLTVFPTVMAIIYSVFCFACEVQGLINEEIVSSETPKVETSGYFY